jgi:GDP-D-mannose dehydratase
MTGEALIAGVSGIVGGAAAEVLLEAGWHVAGLKCRRA